MPRILSCACFLALGLVSACKTADNSTQTKDIEGWNYQDTGPVEPAPSPLKTKKLRARYTTSGFAGPMVNIYDLNDPSSHPSAFAIGTSCSSQGQITACRGRDFEFKLSRADMTATLTAPTHGVDKAMTCATFTASGMTPTTGYDCKEVAGGAASGGDTGSASAGPIPSQIKCTMETDKGGVEWVKFKLDSDGKIVMFSQKKWGSTSTSTYWFFGFSRNVDEANFEWEDNELGPDGEPHLELGTSADAYEVFIDLAKKKGTYQYKDTGAGGGSFGPQEMECTPM